MNEKGLKIAEKQKKYVLQSWSKQGNLNPIPIEKAEGIYLYDFDVKPDIVTFAKGVTCGYVQFGGVAVSSKIAEYFNDRLLSCGLTYSGHPPACAAGVACVNCYKDANILENVNKTGKVLGEILEELKAEHPCVGDVRYIGLFSAIELVKDKATKEPLEQYGIDKKKYYSVIEKMANDAIASGSPANTVKKVTAEDCIEIYKKLYP